MAAALLLPPLPLASLLLPLPLMLLLLPPMLLLPLPLLLLVPGGGGVLPADGWALLPLLCPRASSRS